MIMFENSPSRMTIITVDIVGNNTTAVIVDLDVNWIIKTRHHHMIDGCYTSKGSVGYEVQLIRRQ